MNRSDLKQLVGKNFGYWEVFKVEYAETENVVNLKLKEFDWYEKESCNSFKKYSGKEKDVKILDKYAFEYELNGKFVEAIKIVVKSNKGIYWSHMQELDDAVSSPATCVTTSVQSNWNKFLKEIGEFDEEEYVEKFQQEYIRHLVAYHKNNNSLHTLKKYIDFFAGISEEMETLNNKNNNV